MSASNYEEEQDCFLTILPMIQRVVLRCWDNEHFSYTKSQMILFSILLKRESATMKEVASFLSCSKEQATRVVAPLVDSGFVDRFIDRCNRSFIHIRLTETGKTYILEQKKTYDRNIKNLLSQNLNEEECQTLFKSLQIAMDLLEKVG